MDTEARNTPNTCRLSIQYRWIRVLPYQSDELGHGRSTMPDTDVTETRVNSSHPSQISIPNLNLLALHIRYLWSARGNTQRADVYVVRSFNPNSWRTRVTGCRGLWSFGEADARSSDRTICDNPLGRTLWPLFFSSSASSPLPSAIHPCPRLLTLEMVLFQVLSSRYSIPRPSGSEQDIDTGQSSPLADTHHSGQS